jgi:hypothetical protein
MLQFILFYLALFFIGFGIAFIIITALHHFTNLFIGKIDYSPYRNYLLGMKDAYEKNLKKIP